MNTSILEMSSGTCGFKKIEELNRQDAKAPRIGETEREGANVGSRSECEKEWRNGRKVINASTARRKFEGTWSAVRAKHRMSKTLVRLAMKGLG